MDDFIRLLYAFIIAICIRRILFNGSTVGDLIWIPVLTIISYYSITIYYHDVTQSMIQTWKSLSKSNVNIEKFINIPLEDMSQYSLNQTFTNEDLIKQINHTTQDDIIDHFRRGQQGNGSGSGSGSWTYDPTIPSTHSESEEEEEEKEEEEKEEEEKEEEEKEDSIQKRKHDKLRKRFDVDADKQFGSSCKIGLPPWALQSIVQNGILQGLGVSSGLPPMPPQYDLGPGLPCGIEDVNEMGLYAPANTTIPAPQPQSQTSGGIPNEIHVYVHQDDVKQQCPTEPSGGSSRGGPLIDQNFYIMSRDGKTRKLKSNPFMKNKQKDRNHDDSDADDDKPYNPLSSDFKNVGEIQKPPRPFVSRHAVLPKSTNAVQDAMKGRDAVPSKQLRCNGYAPNNGYSIVKPSVWRKAFAGLDPKPGVFNQRDDANNPGVAKDKSLCNVPVGTAEIRPWTVYSTAFPNPTLEDMMK